MKRRATVHAPLPPFDVGLALLGGCALLFGAGLTYLLYLANRSPADALAEIAAVRFFLACAGALALVTAEALLAGRPWAWRASLALAAAYLVTLGGVSTIGSEDARTTAVDLFWMAAASLAFLLPALLYVRHRHRARFPAATRGRRP